MEHSDYVTIVITVPETHANAVREAMGKAGAGKVGKRVKKGSGLTFGHLRQEA